MIYGKCAIINFCFSFSKWSSIRIYSLEIYQCYEIAQNKPTDVFFFVFMSLCILYVHYSSHKCIIHWDGANFSEFIYRFFYKQTRLGSLNKPMVAGYLAQANPRLSNSGIRKNSIFTPNNLYLT